MRLREEPPVSAALPAVEVGDQHRIKLHRDLPAQGIAPLIAFGGSADAPCETPHDSDKFRGIDWFG